MYSFKNNMHAVFKTPTHRAHINIIKPYQSFLFLHPFDLYSVWHSFPLPFYSCVNLSVAGLIVLALDLFHRV